MVLRKRIGDLTAATILTQWIAVILILDTTSAGNGLSTTPKTDDIIISSMATGTLPTNTNTNSTRSFLQKTLSSSTPTTTSSVLSSSSSSSSSSASQFENKFFDINSLPASSSSHFPGTADAAGFGELQNSGESFSKTSHHTNIYDSDNNHHLNLNNGQNISIAQSNNTSRLGATRNLNENNRRRSIQHEAETNENQIDSEKKENLGEIYFGTENFTTITTQIGSVVVIPCTVYNVDEETISWIRRKDYHLLTVDSTTYSGDARFNTIHIPDSKDWTLQIKYVQSRDAGLYECQVSTHPPTSTFTRLNVVEASAHIPGPTERYLKPGSTLKLICRVVQSLEAPLYLFWYHNSRMINYDLHRGINVTTDLDNRLSELTIYQASTTRSGNYSCVPSNAVPASTFVHILYGENPAAMQHGDTGTIIFISPLLIILISIVTYHSIRLS